MNGQAEFIADIVGLYNKWAAAIGRPQARHVHKKAEESKTCPEENFRILIGTDMSGSYRFFESICLPADNIGQIGRLGQPGYQDFLTIKCSYIEGLSEEQRKEMKAMAQRFIENDPFLSEIKRIQACFLPCDPCGLLGCTVTANNGKSLSISLKLDRDGGIIFSAIDASWPKIGFCEKVNKITSFDEDGNPQAYRYELEVEIDSLVPERMAKILEPLLAELAALEFMSSILKAYNQIAKHSGQKALGYELKEVRELDPTSIKIASAKYFAFQENEKGMDFLREIGIPVKKGPGEATGYVGYADIIKMPVSARRECTSKAEAKLAEICGENRLQRPESALAVASASFAAGGSGGAAAGEAGKVVLGAIP
ncbi:MAG: hypothetical protein K0R66_1330 [Gammaproteobacteria bacterium]|nr:hypothetical protein [Gammaproteobacteria bacterium]